MRNRVHSNSLALLITAVSVTAHAVEEAPRNTFCDVDSISPRSAAVLQTLGAQDYIDLIVSLQTLDRFSSSVENNSLSDKGVSTRNGVRTIRVNCPGGGSMTTTRLSYSGSYQEAIKVIENCALHGKTLNGSYSSIHVPTKYSEIVDIHITSESGDGAVLTFSDAEYKIDFSDHYFSADFDGVKTYGFQEMSKKALDGRSSRVSNFNASVSWKDRYLDMSQLRTSFDLDASNIDGGVNVTTETPLIIDGNSNAVQTGTIVLSEFNLDVVAGRPAGVGRSEIDFSNNDRAVNECVSANTPLRYNSL